MNKRFLAKIIFTSIVMFAVFSFTTYLITTTIISSAKEETKQHTADNTILLV